MQKKIGNLISLNYVATNDGKQYLHKYDENEYSDLFSEKKGSMEFFSFPGYYTKRGIENMKKIKSNPKKRQNKMTAAERKAWGAKMKAARNAKKHANPKPQKTKSDSNPKPNESTLHNGKKIKPSLSKIANKLKNLFEEKTGYYHSPKTIKKLIKTVQNWNPGNVSIFDAYKHIVKEYRLKE